MIFVWIYLVLTAIASFMWFLLVGIDDVKKHSIGVTLGGLAIIALAWPLLAVMVVACVGLSLLSPMSPRSRP